MRCRTYPSDNLRKLKHDIDMMSDSEDKEISIAMVVLIAAIEVGPKIDLLVEGTGFDRPFVELIAANMRKAGLWFDDRIDDREWNVGDEPNLYALFIHAGVATGGLKREATRTRIRYIEVDTGDVAAEWRIGREGTGVKVTRSKRLGQ